MTNQNNAEHHLHELLRLTQPWPGATIPCATVRSHVEQALSKLRAPVADERAEFSAWHVDHSSRAPNLEAPDGQWADDKKAWAAWQERARRAALASAPVAGMQPLEPEFAKVLSDNFESLMVRAPVAGEAQTVASPTAQAFAQLAKQYPVRPIEDAQHPDDAAVDRFAAAMKAKLAAKRAAGRGGWDDKTECSAEFLSELLRGHVEKGDPLDVGNFAMMLHQRGERITSAAPQASEAVRDAASERLHALVREAISWLETGGGRADSLCADLRKALSEQPGAQKEQSDA